MQKHEVIGSYKFRISIKHIYKYVSRYNFTLHKVLINQRRINSFKPRQLIIFVLTSVRKFHKIFIKRMENKLLICLNVLKAAQQKELSFFQKIEENIVAENET